MDRISKFDKLRAFVYLLYTDDPTVFNAAYKLLTGRTGKSTWFYLHKGKI